MFRPVAAGKEPTRILSSIFLVIYFGTFKATSWPLWPLWPWSITLDGSVESSLSDEDQCGRGGCALAVRLEEHRPWRQETGMIGILMDWGYLGI